MQAGQTGQASIDEAALKTALVAGIADAAGNAFTYTANSGVIANIDATALPVIDTLAPTPSSFEAPSTTAPITDLGFTNIIYGSNTAHDLTLGVLTLKSVSGGGGNMYAQTTEHASSAGTYQLSFSAKQTDLGAQSFYFQITGGFGGSDQGQIARATYSFSTKTLLQEEAGNGSIYSVTVADDPSNAGYLKFTLVMNLNTNSSGLVGAWICGGDIAANSGFEFKNIQFGPSSTEVA